MLAELVTAHRVRGLAHQLAHGLTAGNRWPAYVRLVLISP